MEDITQKPIRFNVPDQETSKIKQVVKIRSLKGDENQLARIEAKVDFVLRHLGLKLEITSK